MAEAVQELIQNVLQLIEKAPSFSGGMLLAYGSTVIMALLSIFFASHRSIKHHEEKFKEDNESKVLTITRLEAIMLPLKASCALFALYIALQSKKSNGSNPRGTATGVFFCIVGVHTLFHLLRPVVDKVIPASIIPNTQYQIHFKKWEGERSQDIINYRYSLYDVFCLICCSTVGFLLLGKQLWIANNLIAIGFAVREVQLMHLNNVFSGFILLIGFFFYDIFWVLGTNVMATVSKSFEAPIKIIFPQDLLINGFKANHFAVLGLGDIVVPGLFIALLLRFDHSLKRNSKMYFYGSFVAYFVGLTVTILMRHITNRTQPSLLYLVPACLGTTILLALFKGDLKALFKYEDSSPPEANLEIEEETSSEEKNK